MVNMKLTYKLLSVSHLKIYFRFYFHMIGKINALINLIIMKFALQYNKINFEYEVH